jgi:hypothetical protein
MTDRSAVLDISGLTQFVYNPSEMLGADPRANALDHSLQIRNVQ